MENMGWTDILEKVRVTLFFYIQVRVGSGAGGIQFIVGSGAGGIQLIVGSRAGSIQFIAGSGAGGIQFIVGIGAGSIKVRVGIGAGSILSIQDYYLGSSKQWSWKYTGLLSRFQQVMELEVY